MDPEEKEGSCRKVTPVSHGIMGTAVIILQRKKS